MLHRAVHRADVVFLDQHIRLPGQFDLGLFRRPLQPRLQQAVVARAVEPGFGFQVAVDAVQDDRVEVVAAEVIVAARGQHFDHAALDRYHRHVERAAAEVVYQDLALPGVAGVVGEGRGRGLVDDPHHLQAGDPARLPGSPAAARR